MFLTLRSLILIFIFTTLTPLPLQAFQLYHRILHPSLPDQSFFNRGSLILSDPIHIDPAPSLQYDLLTFIETSAQVTDALYQLALALDPQPGETGSVSESPLWLISSVKACHLTVHPNDHIILHLPYPGGPPFALEYFIDSVPLDGTCPQSQPSGPILASSPNATITFSFPSQPPLPDLRTPPPLTATGDPVVHVPEKSFVQKYWLYIVIALGALLIAPAGEEGSRDS
ncbi:hypothetical protein B0F90DRAFT_1814082 [Multifurca ochricompacta]|uniref:ER membrane protein complex subunit 10 n=1 Tax=Multifurca ochricompacta TaxID=376703 RepID=A0AAD4ME37_9AGAM|nr:hypothetical protein B0F90DRAFT_1814082 [Multifurca ochricompacta]